MKHLRHTAWWAFVAVAIIPVIIMAAGKALYEATEVPVSRLHSWCFQEKYRRLL